MVKIPSSLHSLFSATIDEHDGTYVLEVPSSEVEQEAVAPGKSYRVAILESASTPESTMQQESQERSTREVVNQDPPEPPVEEGEIRDLTVETVGDQGDGLAKVERGYVVIVPGTQPGQQPTVEIEEVQENVAFASIVDRDP